MNTILISSKAGNHPNNDLLVFPTIAPTPRPRKELITSGWHNRRLDGPPQAPSVWPSIREKEQGMTDRTTRARADGSRPNPSLGTERVMRARPCSFLLQVPGCGGHA